MCNYISLFELCVDTLSVTPAVLPQSSAETEFWPYLLNQQRQEHRQQNAQDAARSAGGFWSDLADYDGPASSRGGVVGREGGRGELRGGACCFN